jgi:hypothetical protein
MKSRSDEAIRKVILREAHRAIPDTPPPYAFESVTRRWRRRRLALLIASPLAVLALVLGGVALSAWLSTPKSRSVQPARQSNQYHFDSGPVSRGWRGHR